MDKKDLLTPSELEDFEERSAILEFDAKMSREDAERLALKLVMAKRPGNAQGTV